MKTDQTVSGRAGYMDVVVRRHHSAASSGENLTASVISEFPLTINVDNDSFTVMRTRGDDRDLVTGFLLTEGLIDSIDDINMLNQCRDTPDVIIVKTAGNRARTGRNMVITSSCGLCGHENIPALLGSLSRVDSSMKLPLEALFEIPARVRELQALFTRTGGSHAAALFDVSGNIVAVREDVGRHNALDKVLGHALLTGVSAGSFGIFLSGRVSLELVIKAVRARVPVVAAVSAPTAAAVEASDRLGITLCGFVRGNDVSVYSNGQRIICLMRLLQKSRKRRSRRSATLQRCEKWPILDTGGTTSVSSAGLLQEPLI